MTGGDQAQDGVAHSRLASVRCLMVDMDGVLFRGGRMLPSADELPSWLTSRGIAFRLLTNNATATPQQNVDKLAALGVMVSPDDVLTSAQATAQYLVENGAAGQSAFVVGETGLRDALLGAGIKIVATAIEARWVVVGLDRTVTYEMIQEACFAIQNGSKFVASNADTSLPVERGNAPGAGAIQAAITAVTGEHPVVIGKPESAMLLQTMAEFKVSPDQCAMLGDRLDTDIEAAKRLNIMSILVLTGVTTPEQLAESRIHPDLIFAGLPELLSAWENRSET